MSDGEYIALLLWLLAIIPLGLCSVLNKLIKNKKILDIFEKVFGFIAATAFGIFLVALIISLIVVVILMIVYLVF